MKFQYIKDKGKAGTTGFCNVDTSQPDWFIRQTFGVEINGKPVQNSTASLNKAFSAIKIVSFSCKKSLNCCFPLIFPLNLLVTY